MSNDAHMELLKLAGLILDDAPTDVISEEAQNTVMDIEPPPSGLVMLKPDEDGFISLSSGAGKEKKSTMDIYKHIFSAVLLTLIFITTLIFVGSMMGGS